MNKTEKLAVLLDHWIEHNAAHEQEFASWAGKASEEGLAEVAQDIHAAAEHLHQAQHLLEKAHARLRPDAAAGRRGGHHHVSD